ncbi:aldehyde dehydrogenase family protein, partial [Alteribacillus sp. JSM 102045]|uniref:aldehyde dehydrogenase family protein n=1 Tax=Alteribacillus sp. JSM 102045 TaxID=1562101 RepID=UPI0035BF81D2
MATATETKTYLNFINGAWVKGSSNDTSASINPANTEDIVGRVQKSTREDLDKAVAAAKEAQTPWRKLAAPERGNLLYKVADVLESRVDDIAKTMTREMGKTFPEAKGETARGVAILRYYAGEGMRKVGDVIPSTDKDA